MNINQNNIIELSNSELERIDGLLSSARTFHYWCFVLAGISLAIASLDKLDSLTLPLGGLTLPNIQAGIAVYLVALVLSIMAERLFSMAYPWLSLDKRRPPFPWIALSGTITYRGVTTWIILPLFLCCIFTSLSIRGDYVGMGLIYGGLGAFILPRTISYYRKLIIEKADHRGGKATLSIYLLYWLRMIRQSFFTMAFITAVLAAVPKWRTSLLDVIIIIVAIIIAIFIFRMIGGIPLFYRWIDRQGKRFGFPTGSEHYR